MLLSAGAGAPGQVFGVGDDQIVGQFGSHYLSLCRESAGGRRRVRSRGTATRLAWVSERLWLFFCRFPRGPRRRRMCWSSWSVPGLVCCGLESREAWSACGQCLRNALGGRLGCSRDDLTGGRLMKAAKNPVVEPSSLDKDFGRTGASCSFRMSAGPVNCADSCVTSTPARLPSRAFCWVLSARWPELSARSGWIVGGPVGPLRVPVVLRLTVGPVRAGIRRHGPVR